MTETEKIMNFKSWYINYLFNKGYFEFSKNDKYTTFVRINENYENVERVYN